MNPLLNESKYASVRAEIINKMTEKYQLTTLIDYGVNDNLYKELTVPNITAIENVQNFLTYSKRYSTIWGWYEKEINKYIQPNCLYTYFSLIDRQIKIFDQFLDYMYENAQENTYLIKWYKVDDIQYHTIYDLKERIEITLE